MKTIAKKGNVLKAGKLVLDEEACEVSCNGDRVKVTETECAILKIFMEQPYITIDKSEVLDKISGDTPNCTRDSLEQQLGNLCKKINKLSEVAIEERWGRGLKLIADFRLYYPEYYQF